MATSLARARSAARPARPRLPAISSAGTWTQHKGGQRADWSARRAGALDPAAQLSDYARPQQGAGGELNELAAEVLRAGRAGHWSDDVRGPGGDDQPRHGRDGRPGEPGGPGPGSQLGGRPAAPALVKGLGDRRRVRGRDHPAAPGTRGRSAARPLDGHTSYGRTETGAGLIAACPAALEALEPQLTRDGCEKLAAGDGRGGHAGRGHGQAQQGGAGARPPSSGWRCPTRTTRRRSGRCCGTRASSWAPAGPGSRR